MQKTSTHTLHAYAVAVGMAVILVGVLALSQMASAQMKLPKDLAMTLTGDAAPVIFSHHQHAEAQHLKCTNCHTKIFQMQAGKTATKHGPLTMAAMADGKFCGTCHNGKTAFDVNAKESCIKCHMKK